MEESKRRPVKRQCRSVPPTIHTETQMYPSHPSRTLVLEGCREKNGVKQRQETCFTSGEETTCLQENVFVRTLWRTQTRIWTTTLQDRKDTRTCSKSPRTLWHGMSLVFRITDSWTCRWSVDPSPVRDTRFFSLLRDMFNSQ